VNEETFSCASRFWRRRRRKNPKIAKIRRVRPPITPPTIEPTDPFGAEVADTELPAEVGVEDVNVGSEDVDIGSEDVDVVVDDDVPFWIMR
jgi:hypothetical protein